MEIIHSLEEFSTKEEPVALSIGNFDGVHLGHQAVLSKLRQTPGKRAVITFENHPATILRPNSPSQRICTLEHRIKLLEAQGVDTLILLKFTRQFSEQSAELFLTKLKEQIPFSQLILGYDTTLGYDRQGDPEKIAQLAQELNFEVEYIPAFSKEGTTVSSSLIRTLILEGNFQEASRFLGRPYSICSTVIIGNGKGTEIGYPTANLEVEGLCLPPTGVYAVQVQYENLTIPGAAYLTSRLEVYLFDFRQVLYGQLIEVIFCEHIRPELKFTNTESLKRQIKDDVQKVKSCFLSL